MYVHVYEAMNKVF